MVADVTYDVETRTTRRGQNVIDLTRTERRLFHRLMVADGAVVSHDDLLRGVWSGEKTERRDYLRTYMSRLRTRLGWNGEGGPDIRAVRGEGYRIALSEG